MQNVQVVAGQSFLARINMAARGDRLGDRLVLQEVEKIVAGEVEVEVVHGHFYADEAGLPLRLLYGEKVKLKSPRLTIAATVWGAHYGKPDSEWSDFWVTATDSNGLRVIPTQEGFELARQLLEEVAFGQIDAVRVTDIGLADYWTGFR